MFRRVFHYGNYNIMTFRSGFQGSKRGFQGSEWHFIIEKGVSTSRKLLAVIHKSHGNFKQKISTIST